MKFKKYHREFERVFNDKKLIDKKCNIEKVSTFNNIPSTITEYISLYTDIFKDFQNSLFDYLVKYVWLNRRFCYRGYNRKKSRANGVELDRAFGIFMRYFVGFDNRFFSSRDALWARVMVYFDDFFPNFNEGNPFKESYEYPYKYISLEYLVFVYQMPNRLELLKYAERKKMSYTKFLDYVLNYISCYNEEHGETYLFVFSHVVMPYIKVLKKI